MVLAGVASPRRYGRTVAVHRKDMIEIDRRPPLGEHLAGGLSRRHFTRRTELGQSVRTFSKSGIGSASPHRLPARINPLIALESANATRGEDGGKRPWNRIRSIAVGAVREFHPFSNSMFF